MTEETENLVLSILRDIRKELEAVRVEQDDMKREMTGIRQDLDMRFDQMADLMTVIVSAQADTIRRVEDLEDVGAS